jgi:hypothetical protein
VQVQHFACTRQRLHEVVHLRQLRAQLRDLLVDQAVNQVRAFPGRDGLAPGFEARDLGVRGGTIAFRALDAAGDRASRLRNRISVELDRARQALSEASRALRSRASRSSCLRRWRRSACGAPGRSARRTRR